MKKLIEKMNKLNLNPKKEILILVSVFFGIIIVSVVLGIILKNPLFIGFGAGFALIFAFLYLTRYGAKLDKIEQENLDDFSNLFCYFRIYLKDGFNVYSALKEITLFASPSLKENLELLIEEIDEDKSVQPFINFSRNFTDIIIEELMISIYQMVDNGETNSYLNQFELIFDKFQELHYQRSLRKKDTRLGTLSSSALIGSVFLIIVLTIGIMSVLGGMVDGL